MKSEMTLKTMLGVSAALAMIAGPALAQDAATPAVPAPLTAAPAEAAPAAAPVEAAPAAPDRVVEALAPDEPPPVLPTTGDGAVVAKLLSEVCQPLINDAAPFRTLVQRAGLREDRRNPGLFAIPLSQRPFEITMREPGANNPNLCEMTIRYAPGWDQPIIDAMNIWRFLHSPQLVLQRNDIGNYTDIQRTTTTWDNWMNQGFDGEMVGLVLVQKNNLNGNPVFGNGYDEALIQYSTRPPLTTEEAREAVAAEEAEKAEAVASEAAGQQPPPG